MFRRPLPKRFLYRAHAVAASGTFTKPRAEFLEAQAPCALPITGGVASARTESIRFREAISIRAAHTDAVGIFNQETGAFSTLVTAVVEGLDVLGVVTADRIVGRLASRHTLEDREPSILTVGSHFENLRVAGEPVHFHADREIQGDWDTYKKALDGCGGRKTGVTIAGDGAIISASIVKDVVWNGLPAPENRIDIPDFGSIHLGEIFIQGGQRHLTMLRIVLGCAYEAEAAFSDVEGDGHPFPP